MLSLALLLLLQTPGGLKTGTASDYAVPQTFIIQGKVIVGLDEPVMAVVTLTEVYTDVTQTTQSFANGTFRFNNVVLGTYRVKVVDPKFDLYDRQLLLREPSDTSNEVTVRLVRTGESGDRPQLDESLYLVDADTVTTTPAKALEEYNNGVSALRNPARSNPADAHFRKAIDAAPNFYEAHLQLGLELIKQQKDADAIRELERAAAIKPSEPRTWRVLGEVYWKAEKYDKVVTSLSKLADTKSMRPRDHYYLGTAYYRVNQLDPAEEELLLAINTGNDTDPEPFLQLHNVFMKKKQPDRGLAVLEDYLKTFPNDANHAAMEERVKALKQAMKLPPI
jgi:tetratricopeptide (TPR) repeat protein